MEKKVWRKFCTESYLNWKLFYRIRPLSEAAKDMLNKETIVLRRPFTTYISELFPVFHRMSLVSMDERRMEFSIHNSNTHGVQIDSQTKKRIFKEFWKEVERSHDPKGYVAMIGMEEYPMLGIENAVEIHMVDFSELEGLSLSMNDMEAIEVSGDTIMGLWGRNQSVYGSIHWMSN